MNPILQKKNEHSLLMERRSQKRVSTNLEARFFYGNLFYSGKVMNLSEKGMFIGTKRFLPSETTFVILFRVDDQLIKVISRVKRNEKGTPDGYGMGVEILSPSVDYMEYVKGLKSA